MANVLSCLDGAHTMPPGLRASNWKYFRLAIRSGPSDFLAFYQPEQQRQNDQERNENCQDGEHYARECSFRYDLSGGRHCHGQPIKRKEPYDCAGSQKHRDRSKNQPERSDDQIHGRDIGINKPWCFRRYTIRDLYHDMQHSCSADDHRCGGYPIYPIGNRCSHIISLALSSGTARGDRNTNPERRYRCVLRPGKPKFRYLMTPSTIIHMVGRISTRQSRYIGRD